MMTGKQKLYFLLGAIVDARDIAPSGQPLVIDPAEDLNQNYRPVELSQLFTKLEKDKQVLRVIKAPNRTKRIGIVEDLDPYEDADDGCWHIELLPAFNKYFLTIQEEPEYQEFTGKKPKNQEVNDDKSSNIPITSDRKALEKIWNVLQEIEEKKQLGSEGSPVRIPCYLSYEQDTDEVYEARKTILEKLQSLEAIVGLHKGVAGAFNYWSFSLGNDYESIFNNYKVQYEKSAINYQKTHPDEKPNLQEIVYEVKYSETSRELLVNNFLLAKPDFNSENDLVFSYLIANPNRTIQQSEIEDKIGSPLTKSLHKIIENLGFENDLKRAFFSVSKTSVYFRNPVKKSNLEALSIRYIKLSR